MREGDTANRGNWRDVTSVAVILLVALYLIPEGAHFFAMFNKLRMSPDAYMTAQRAYDGWALFGVGIVLAIGSTLGHAIAVWKIPTARAQSLGALAMLVGTQIIFWAFIHPMNAATANWTRMTADFDVARRQWEFAHAASAGLTMLALLLTVCAALSGAKTCHHLEATD